MMTFYDLSSTIRALFALWALLLCLSTIVIGVRALIRKRFLNLGLSLLFFAPVYIFWQAIFDLSLFKQNKISDINSLTFNITHVRWWLYILVFGIMSICLALLFAYDLRRDKTTITPNSIKQFLDETPCGVCCWRQGGQIVLSNECMNDLCIALTGGTLMNGRVFADVVKNGMIEVGGKVWKFASRDMEMDGEPLFELIASDVTGEYAKTQALEKDKAELSRINKELKDYTKILTKQSDGRKFCKPRSIFTMK